ncbi:hypothetical protein TNCT_695921 [Trichonephila clavata]|uniref:Uncharacterized protein n=1 Tax=Trichonephila clavata TaxID=2740835 RepID=A0A8X6FYA0_TRICU|nr:hypothetical protein TNCT_695921 [Trichonephila clavata]
MFLICSATQIKPLISFALHSNYFSFFHYENSLPNIPITPINERFKRVPANWSSRQLAIRSGSLATDPPHQTLMRSNQPPGKRMDPPRQQRAEEIQ